MDLKEILPILKLSAWLYGWLSLKMPLVTNLGPEGFDIIFLVLGAFIVVNFVAVAGGIMTFLERRVAGRIQFRVGPNRVGPQGILQFLADGIKLIQKEDLIPDDADEPLFRLGPYLVVVGTMLAFAVIPLSSRIFLVNLNVGILYVLSVTSFVVIGIMMSGWASNSKWALLGALRSAAQIIAYEIPAGMAILNVVFLSGTLSIDGIIRAQGAWPWQWNMFYNPFTFVSVFIYFTAALAENNRTPFDIPEAESELVSGYNTEYSGMRFGLFFMAEFANVFLISALCTALFLGGWKVPWTFGSTLLQELSELGAFMFKSSFLVVLVLQLRWTLPRLRVDQLMAMCWKYLVPVAFVNIMGTAIWMTLWPQGLSWVSMLLTALMAAICLNYALHIRKDLMAKSGKLRFNPLS